MKDSGPQSNIVTKQEYQALVNHIEGSTRPIRNMKDRNQLSTAVAVRLGGRRFLATAGHVLVANHQMALLLEDGEYPVIEARREWRFDPEVDVGFIELNDESEVGDLRFVEAASILTRLNAECRNPVLLVGFMAREFQVQGNGRLGFVLYAGSFVTLPRQEWPESWCVGMTSRPARLSHNRDVFLRLPDDRRVKYVHSNSGEWLGSISTMPEPHGLSGAGLWFTHCRLARGHSPWQAQPKLIAIRGSYRSASGVLRATRIDCWLKLLLSHYPELRAELEGIRQESCRFGRRLRRRYPV